MRPTPPLPPSGSRHKPRKWKRRLASAKAEGKRAGLNACLVRSTSVSGSGPRPSGPVNARSFQAVHKAVMGLLRQTPDPRRGTGAVIGTRLMAAYRRGLNAAGANTLNPRKLEGEQMRRFAHAVAQGTRGPIECADTMIRLQALSDVLEDPKVRKEPWVRVHGSSMEIHRAVFHVAGNAPLLGCRFDPAEFRKWVEPFFLEDEAIAAAIRAARASVGDVDDVDDVDDEEDDAEEDEDAEDYEAEDDEADADDYEEEDDDDEDDDEDGEDQDYEEEDGDAEPEEDDAE